MILQPLFGWIKNPYTGTYNTAVPGWGFGYFINNIVSAAFLIAGLMAFAFLVMGGIRYLTSAGDAKAVTDASKSITNAVLGLAIVAAAYFLVQILQSVLGINILTPSFSGPR